MPQSPYAKLRASINGGAVQTGGITVPASATVQLSADATASVGATQYKYEIYGYPLGFTQPSGWSTDSAGVYYYSSGTTPPIFTLPTIANWGKFMLRLTLNNAISTNPVAIPVAQLVDSSTALSMLSPTGLADVGLYESNQFSSTWTPALQASLRAVDGAVTAVAGANAKPPAKLVSIGNIASLSGEQTIDSVLTAVSRVLLTGQATTSQNGLWLTGAGAWTRPADFNSDGQVIVGQTVFVTNGTVYSSTNWQLTSGGTIAGAKTYAQLSATTQGVIQPVDALATSNISLSGTTSVDGVSLTAAASRVLAISQTTSSQNGVWLVQSGSWTRPSDFGSDAQVIPGQTVYVKPGGSTGGDTTWYLKTGSTIAGSKTYVRASTGKIAPVRAVQTQVLYTIYGDPWVYDNTAQTWSEPYVVGGLTGATWYAFDNIIPQLGDRLDVYGTSTPDSAAIGNGVYTITSLGSGATKAVLTRAPDLNASVAFAAPIAYEVYDGTRYKGARRQLVTQGAITLGTTPLQFGTVQTQDALHVDLSKAPYFIRDWPSPTAWGGNVDYSVALNQALYDYRNTAAVLRLPSANGGNIYLKNPIDHYGTCLLKGDGQNGSALVQYGWAGGHMVVAQELHPSVGLDGFPQVGPTVDTATNATSLSTYYNGNGDTGRWFFYNLSHGGLLINDWTQFEMRTLIRLETLGVNVPESHVVSCRGRRTNVDTLDSGVGGSDGLFKILVNEGVSPKTITASMRLTDTTAGVYGTTVHVGAGTGTVAGDGTVKPTEDAANLIFRIATAGVAGGTLAVQWAVDGQRYCAPVLVPAGGALVAGFRNEVNEYDQTFTAKFNFSGTFVAGDTYAIPCTGVNQLVTLTSTVALAVNTNYDICLQYRGGKVYLYVSVAGGTLDASSTTTGVSATGVLRQRYWEWVCFGRAANYAVFEAGADFNGFQGWLGSILFRNSSVAAPGATVTTLYDSNSYTFPGQKFSFTPNTTDLRKDAAGVLRRRYGGFLDYSGGPNTRTWILPRNVQTGGNHAFGGVQGMTLQAGPNTNQHDSGMLIQVWTSGIFRDLRFTGGNKGLSIVGPFFANDIADITWNARDSFDVEFHQGSLTIGGFQNFSGGSKPCMMQLSSCQLQAPGTLFMNTELTGTGSRKLMLLSDLQGGYLANIQCDAENQQQNPTGRELIRASIGVGYTLRIEGNFFLIENYSVLTQVIGGSDTGKVSLGKLNVTTSGVTLSNVGLGNYPPFSVIGAGGPPIEVGPDFAYLLATTATGFPVPMVDTVNKWQLRGVAGSTLLTSGSQSVTYQRGVTLKLANNTLAANSTYTIGTVGAVTGDTQDILIESQATYTTTIANGGSAGATGIYVNPTTAAATKDRYRLRFDEKFNWVSV